MKLKQIIGVMYGAIWLACFSGQAQTSVPGIPSRPLEITYAKTTTIVFPYAIKSVDRGSKEVLVQKVAGMENILQVKAARKDFEETNLTIVTADGALYAFTVNYAPNPSQLNFLLTTGIQNSGTVQFTSEKINAAQMRLDAIMVSKTERKTTRIVDRKFGVTLLLNGLFIRDQIIYYRLKVANDTHFPYDVEQLRFFIRDYKKAKRTAIQEVEVKPVYVEGKTEKIEGKQQQVIVIGLSKFTIPDKKYLAIQLLEKNGGRHLGLKVKNRTIVHAEPVQRLEIFNYSLLNK